MAVTPNKLVHWDLGLSPDSGSFEGDSTDSDTSASSLQYVNSQLLAHGFTQGSGLSLDGLAKDDTEKVVKCLLGMLSQRVVRDLFSSFDCDALIACYIHRMIWPEQKN